MSWLSYIFIAVLLALVFFAMDLFYKIQQDIKFIKHNIEKVL